MSYFKLNDPVNARKVLTVSRTIRERILDPSDEELAATYGNLGNLEAAEGNLDLAMKYQRRSLAIREKLSGTEIMRGIVHQCMGRIFFLKGEYQAAAEEYRRCETLFLEYFGPEYLMIW